MERVAVFPGTFDPFTVGHEAVVRRALNIFDKIVIAVGKNVAKKNAFYHRAEDEHDWRCVRQRTQD